MDTAIFKNLHIKLTLLCIGITAVIMLVMSFFYLYISEQELYKNQFKAFQNDVNTITTNLEQQSVITMEWLSKMEARGNYKIFVLDNGIPFLYNQLSDRSQNLSQEQLLKEAMDTCNKLFSVSSSGQPDSLYISYHFEYEFTSDGIDYFGSMISTGRSNSHLEVIVLYPLSGLKKQIQGQRLRFLLIDFAAILALTVFAFIFTGKLLKPVMENQQKQVQFIASASHELRTPLAVILSAAECCKTAPEDNRDTFFKTIRQEGEHMSSLINDMLTLSQADNSCFSVSPEPVELDTLLINSFEAFEPLAKEKAIVLHLHLPSEALPPCMADPMRLSQVLAILLHNAISYTPAQGMISLSLSYREIPKKHFYIVVQDNGPGISDEDKTKIFDRFYRAEKSRSTKGHFGLGLSIAYEIIKSHGGSITVSDAPEGGAIFTVVL